MKTRPVAAVTGAASRAPQARGVGGLQRGSALAAIELVVADGFLARLKGLMFAAALPAERGLLIPRCASVHTCFMRQAIDVVYLDEGGRITRLVEELPPWRFSFGGGRARQTLELASGSIGRLQLRLGDCVVDVPPKAMR